MDILHFGLTSTQVRARKLAQDTKLSSDAREQAIITLVYYQLSTGSPGREILHRAGVYLAHLTLGTLSIRKG